jgi:hypothetical protein
MHKHECFIEVPGMHVPTVIWRPYVPQKGQYLQEPQGVTSPKTAIFNSHCREKPQILHNFPLWGGNSLTLFFFFAACVGYSCS